jgi:hypothetical protein
VEEFAEIRRVARVEGLSINALAKRFGAHRRTVRAGVGIGAPPGRKTPERAAPKLETVRELIDGMLRQDIDAPRKQGQTATRIWRQLLDEHGSKVGYPTVRDYVRVRRPEIMGGPALKKAMAPQVHLPGAEAEVDFGEFYVLLKDVRTKCYLFDYRLSASGRSVHRVYPTQAQEAFLEGHIDAFEETGGIPTMQIKYDNLSAAVRAVVYGGQRQRVENDRWVLFRSHYGFDPFLLRAGHRRRSRERRRRRGCGPVPPHLAVSDSRGRLARRTERADARLGSARRGPAYRDADDDRGRGLRRRARAAESAAAGSLRSGLELYPRVDRSGLISVRMARYSVPVAYINRRPRVSLRASELVVFDGRKVIARHERVISKAASRFSWTTTWKC